MTAAWSSFVTSDKRRPGAHRTGLGHSHRRANCSGSECHPLYMFVKDADLPVPLFGSIPGVNQTASINGAGMNTFGGVFETLL